MHPIQPKDVKLNLRTADQTRRAELDVDRGQTAADLIQSAVDHWALPTDTDYTLVNVTRGTVLAPQQALDEDTVKPGDLLEVQPVLVAGAGQPGAERTPNRRRTGVETGVETVVEIGVEIGVGAGVGAGVEAGDRPR